MDKHKKIIPVFSGSLIEVRKLANDLRDEGIDVLVKDNKTMALLSGFANISHPELELYILETEIEKAKPVVAKFKKRFKL